MVKLFLIEEIIVGHINNCDSVFTIGSVQELG